MADYPLVAGQFLHGLEQAPLPGQLGEQGCFHNRIFAHQLNVDEVAHVALQIHLGGQLDAQEQGVEDAQISYTSGRETQPPFEEGVG